MARISCRDAPPAQPTNVPVKHTPDQSKALPGRSRAWPTTSTKWRRPCCGGYWRRIGGAGGSGNGSRRKSFVAIRSSAVGACGDCCCTCSFEHPSRLGSTRTHQAAAIAVENGPESESGSQEIRRAGFGSPCREDLNAMPKSRLRGVTVGAKSGGCTDARRRSCPAGHHRAIASERRKYVPCRCAGARPTHQPIMSVISVAWA